MAHMKRTCSRRVGSPAAAGPAPTAASRRRCRHEPGAGPRRRPTAAIGRPGTRARSGTGPPWSRDWAGRAEPARRGAPGQQDEGPGPGDRAERRSAGRQGLQQADGPAQRKVPAGRRSPRPSWPPGRRAAGAAVPGSRRDLVVGPDADPEDGLARRRQPGAHPDLEGRAVGQGERVERPCPSRRSARRRWRPGRCRAGRRPGSPRCWPWRSRRARSRGTSAAMTRPSGTRTSRTLPSRLGLLVAPRRRRRRPPPRREPRRRAHPGCPAGRARCPAAPAVRAASTASRTRSPAACENCTMRTTATLAAGHPGPARRLDLDVLADDAELAGRRGTPGRSTPSADAGCRPPRARGRRGHRAAAVRPPDRRRGDDVARSQAGAVGRGAIDDRDDERCPGALVEDDTDAQHAAVEGILLGRVLLCREVLRVALVAERLEHAADGARREVLAWSGRPRRRSDRRGCAGPPPMSAGSTEGGASCSSDWAVVAVTRRAHETGHQDAGRGDRPQPTEARWAIGRRGATPQGVDEAALARHVAAIIEQTAHGCRRAWRAARADVDRSWTTPSGRDPNSWTNPLLRRPCHPIVLYSPEGPSRRNRRGWSASHLGSAAAVQPGSSMSSRA